MKEVDIRPTSDRRGNNIFSSYLGGIKPLLMVQRNSLMF